MKKKNLETEGSFTEKDEEIARPKIEKSKKQSVEDDVMKKSKEKNKEKIDEDGVKEKSKKEIRVNSETEDSGKKKSKNKTESGDEKEKPFDDISVDSVGNVEAVESEHNSTKKKKKNRETTVEDEEIQKLDEGKVKSKKQNVKDGVKKKSKKKRKNRDDDDCVKKNLKEMNADSEAEDGGKKKKKKKEYEKEEPLDDSNSKTGKRKRDEIDFGAHENTDNEIKRTSKKKKMKPIVESEVHETSFSSTKDAKNKKTKHNVDSEVEDNKLNSIKDAKKNEKRPSEDSESGEIGLNSTKDAKKKRNKRKQSEVSEAHENNNEGEDAKKKLTGTTLSNKSSKRVTFSDQVEYFPAEDEEREHEEEDAELVRGKRFTKEEDELIKKAVWEYIDNHALGDEGLNMVMDCQNHKEVKGCWKEIESALPWRPRYSVYNRAHTLFESGSKGIWTKEDLELVKQFQEKHGNDWKTLADAMGKHRIHVKDAWRRIRLNMNKGHWSREEYQSLFDLVNKDIRMKAYQEKHSKHGMLRDNIPWMAISDVLGTRSHMTCCTKWYDQLTSPMIVQGTWANVDDYRLLEELLKLDAACIDDVDWDNLLENRDGEACKKRWNQMVRHIGLPKSKTFAEQVEILSERYCPDLAEDRENFDNRPYD